MAEKVSNNTAIYHEESNYAHYYRQYFSSHYQAVILGRPQLPTDLPVSALDRRWVIEKQYHYRVDLIAQKWYSADYIDFIWIIMLYNQATENTALIGKEPVNQKIILPSDPQPHPETGVNPFVDFPAGREIYIPARTTLEDIVI